MAPAARRGLGTRATLLLSLSAAEMWTQECFGAGSWAAWGRLAESLGACCARRPSSHSSWAVGSLERGARPLLTHSGWMMRNLGAQLSVGGTEGRPPGPVGWWQGVRGTRVGAGQEATSSAPRACRCPGGNQLGAVALSRPGARAVPLLPGEDMVLPCWALASNGLGWEPSALM